MSATFSKSKRKMLEQSSSEDESTAWIDSYKDSLEASSNRDVSSVRPGIWLIGSTADR